MPEVWAPLNFIVEARKLRKVVTAMMVLIH